LAYSYHVAPGPNPPQEIDFLATVVALPVASVCAQGLEPAAPEVWTDDGFGGSQVAGSTVRRTLAFEQITDPDTQLSSYVAQTTVSALAVDVCGANGASSRSWPVGAPFEHLRTGVLVCFRAADGRITMEVQDLSVPVACVGLALPQTGGVRIRTPLAT
jgi:hypothetical protein